MPPPPPATPYVAPSSPSDAVVNSICDAAGFLPTGVTLGIVAAALVVGILIGYLGGRRKAILEALKKAIEAAKASAAERELKKMKADGAGQDDKEEEEEDEAKKEEAQQLLEEFLNRSSAPGMDDHPQAFINPILMLQIKKKKEEVRRDKMYEKLLASQNFEEGYLEGLTPEERRAKAEELLAEGTGGGALSGGVGSVEGVVRRWGANTNSTRILVDAGATLVPGKGSAADDASQEEKLVIEVRDKLKQIDQHLNKHLEIDVAREDRAKAANKRSNDGKRLKDALTVANETRSTPFQQSHEVMTFDERRDFAQRGRARVAPPQDHAGQSGGVRSAAGGRRASAAGNALALDAAIQEAKALERKDAEALQGMQA